MKEIPDPGQGLFGYCQFPVQLTSGKTTTGSSFGLQEEQGNFFITHLGKVNDPSLAGKAIPPLFIREHAVPVFVTFAGDMQFQVLAHMLSMYLFE